jgi:hypothetical protein
MDDGSPSLEVGFVIDTGGSFDELQRLQSFMDTTEAKLVADAAKIERATGGMIKLGGAGASISTFANAASRDLQNVAREKARTEKAGEGMVRQLEREAAALGKTKDELREAKVETLALAAAQQGNADLAERLLAASRQRGQAVRAIAEAEAEAIMRATAARTAEEQALRDAAFAHQMFEARVRQGVVAMREEEAATRAAAAAKADLAARAQRLVNSVDPAAAAQHRFNTEMAEARALISSGAISLDQYVAKLQMETNALNGSAVALGNHSKNATKNRMAMQGASYQVQDFITQVSMGANPVNAFAVQGAQLAGQFSEVEGKAGAAARFFMGPWGLAITAALMFLGPLTKKLWETNDALDDAVKKLKKDAEQSAATAKAKDAFAKSIEGVRQAVIDQLKEQEKSLTTDRQVEDQTLATARARIADEVAIRKRTAAVLDAVRAQVAEDQASAGKPDFNRAFRLQQAPGVLKALEAQIAANDAAIGRAEQAARNAMVPVAQRDARVATDRLFAINEQYDIMATQATEAARKNDRLNASLATTLTNIENLRQADIRRYQETQREANRARNQTDGVSRFKTREQAIGLAGKELQGAGMRVDGNHQFGYTSGHSNDADHNKFAIDVNVGRGIVEAKVPHLKKQYDELALLYQSRGYEVIWNGRFYAAGGKGPGNRAAGHENHLHIKAPKTIIGKATQGSTARLEMAEFKDAIKDATEAEAVQAQTANLYKLADAFGVSGGAALVAAARVRAESEAIREKNDVEAAVARDIGLMIAQRVADAAQGTAAMRDQAKAQEQVNAAVAEGLVPADRAAELVKNQMADLPLLAAISAANATKNVEGATRATKALEEQAAARARLAKAERDAVFNVAMASGADRLAEAREELRLVGATEAVRERALVTLRATQEAARMKWDPAQTAEYVARMQQIAAVTAQIAQEQRAINDALSFTADRWDLIARNVQDAAGGMSDAFGNAGRAIGDMASIFANFHADRERMELEHQRKVTEAQGDRGMIERENARFALASATNQIGAFGDMTAAAKSFFNEKSAGYKALAVAEKIFRGIEFAMSVRAMAQDAIETGSKLASSAARTAANAVEAVTKAISSLPFPANIAAGAATIAALAAIGVSIAGSFGGGGRKPEAANEGRGTVFGDPKAQSESIKNSIDALKEVDTLTNTYARQMASSLRSIENQIGGLAALVLRTGDISASAGITEGFKTNAIGSVLGKIPVIGNFLGGLFGTKTTVLASGLQAGPQSLGNILGGGFDASYYSDIQKKKKLFGFTTSNKTSTQLTAADGALEAQFALLLRSFNDAIVAAAGPLGAATADIQNRLNSFVVNLGKIDLKGLTGAEIQEKLSAVFGAAADSMANAAFPGLAEFQKVGEGTFETLIRVASTVEAVGNTLSFLGRSVTDLGLAAQMGLADQFDSVSAFTDAAASYFEDFYSQEEQAAAKTAQMARVFESLGLAMPATLSSFRQLVEAQDLTSAAGQEIYATLLKLAPAFADLQASMDGAKSAADIASERADLQRQLLQLQGDAVAIRALDLAKLDVSNRVLQQQVWAMQDGQEAAKAADDLRKAWQSVGDTIRDEVRRIRGLSDATGGNTFASLMEQFNAATSAARGGDMDAAKALPQLSQALLAAAADAARSRQELDRVRAQTAASLEATLGMVAGLGTAPAVSNAALLTAAATSQPATAPANDNREDLRAAVGELREELAQMRTDLNTSTGAVASNTARIARKLDDITSASGGDAISIVAAA